MNTFLSPLSQERERECLEKLKQNDKEAREELILRNMRLVAHVTKKYVSSEEEMEELISIGTIGLIKAVSSFKADYGNSFATYAIRCIENEILMHFRSKKKSRADVSLFEPIGTDKEGNQIHLVDIIENEDPDVIEDISMENGLDGMEEMTQRQIAGTLRISRSYVSRIEKRALEKLKKFLE